MKEDRSTWQVLTQADVDKRLRETTKTNWSCLRMPGVSFKEFGPERANFRWSTFRGSDCSGVDFTGCDLQHADFAGALLIGADLSNTVRLPESFHDVDLTGALLPKEIPVVEDLDKKILRVIESGKGTLEMETWHGSTATLMELRGSLGRHGAADPSYKIVRSDHMASNVLCTCGRTLEEHGNRPEALRAVAHPDGRVFGRCGGGFTPAPADRLAAALRELRDQQAETARILRDIARDISSIQQMIADYRGVTGR